MYKCSASGEKMKITRKQLRDIIKETLIKEDVGEDAAIEAKYGSRPGEDTFDMVMRRALAVLGDTDFMLDEIDGELVIDADQSLIRQHINGLTDTFPDGSNSRDGFYTGYMA